MESNTPHPMPAGLNQEQTSTPEEHERPNNQPVSYHRSITDGSYVGVNLSPGFRFVPKEEELITDFLNKKINNQPAKYIQISDVNVYKHTPEELAESSAMIQEVFGITQLPRGVRFVPTDQELIMFLINPVPYIFSENIYNFNPRMLTDVYPSLGKDEWYFFTPRDRKYPNGSRPNRAAGDGFWKATVADKRIYDNNDCIGFKKTLVFYEGKSTNGKKTNWIMHEYTVDHPPRHPTGTNDNMRLDNCVLCRIHETKHAAASENENPVSHKRSRTEHESSSRQPGVPAQHDLQLKTMNQGASRFHVQVNFPRGFLFAPTDEELIIYLKKKKIDNEPAPYACISNVNIYKYNPRELTEMYPTLARDEWYFFTSRDRKYPNGSRPNRAAGDGFWKATVADKKIYDNNDCIGFKKALVFYEGKAPNCKKTNWIMHEYTTVDHPPRHPTGTNDNMQLDDCILCHIYERKKTAATHEIEAIHEPSENENLTSHKRARTEQESTNHPGQNAEPDLQLLQPNLPMHQHNQPAVLQYRPIAANHISPGQHSVPEQQQNQPRGQLDYCLQRALEGIEHFLLDDLEDNNEIYFDLSTGDMVDHQPDASVIGQLYLHVQNSNDFAPHSSMDCSGPNLLYNGSNIFEDYPQEGNSYGEMNQSEKPRQQWEQHI